MPRTNSYPGRCRICDTRVGEQKGFIDKINGRWVTYCNSSRCLPTHLATEVVAEADPKLTANGEILMGYPGKDGLALIKGCPGARWSPSTNMNTGLPPVAAKCWVVSTALQHRMRLLEVADKLGLEVAEELRTDELHPLAEAAKKLGLAGVIDPDTGAHFAAYPYQLEGTAWLAAMENALLADDMGLGKTPQALFAIDPTKGTVVVVPASVKLNWKRECERWRPDLTPMVLKGRNAWHWPAPGEVVITNPDIMPDWLMPTLEKTATLGNGKVINWKVADLDDDAKAMAENTILIADEIHLYKKHTTKRSKKMRELVRACAVAWGLTGTPLENKPLDLWGVLNVFGMAKDVFGGWNGFLRLFGAMKNKWGGYEFGTPSAEVPERLRRVMLRRLKSEVLPELPPKTYATMEVELRSKRLRKALDKAYNEWGDVLEAGELPPFEEFSRLRALLAEDRIPAMLEIVESHEEADTPLLVFSYHRSPIAELAKRDGWAVITGDTNNEKRDAIVQSFQAGELKGVGLTIRAAGVGLTLTHSSHSLFVDLDWVPTWNTQAEDRIHRIGQDSDKVLITRMVSDHPLDLHVHMLLSEKTAMIHAAIENTVGEVTIKRGPGLNVVTDEEHAARMALLAEAARKAEEADHEAALQRIRDRLPHWQARMSARATRPEVELTDAVKPILRDAYGYMLSICDGARERDGEGFNKPDAAIARMVLSVGLDSDDELRLAERMLSRYHRQLHGQFPMLFITEAKSRKLAHKRALEAK